ncbi:BTB/POZ domain-containing protein At1g67900 [Andrographis paniculata]|uniref:BTB/POZ domain-containing protein At1g67900 n=1 Tax=Andrographis paniculata TaxID=175694 RepID=UPI0021E91976|nr:BTB/POZ domain-containing protein At1g67900 [Andrographis paniculata]
MKFMKLGSRPDTFYTSEAVRSVSSEVASDLIVQVKGIRYLLHKFPLLSKSLHLQRLCSEIPDQEPTHHIQIIQLPDFPGGADAFELCAKFCYGITVTLSARNLVAIRCAAEYLQMTEDADKGNLIHKVEAFFNSCILRGWKDSTVTLQSTKAFAPWCEDLTITSRCIESIASKVLLNPSKISLSYSYSRRGGCRDKHKDKDWWADDLAELPIDLYWRTMAAIKSGGKVPAALVGDALRIYASRWLHPDASTKKIDDSRLLDMTAKHRLLLESIVSLLPVEKGAASCSFLSKLLKAANILNASSSSKIELARRVALQLDDATVGDLLIPSPEIDDMLYDVDVVIMILELFMTQGQSPPASPTKLRGEFERRRSRSAENIDSMFHESRRSSSSASHGSKLKVAKIVDGYLQKIAADKNLPLSKFVAVAESVPEFARLDHDDLYKAVDVYLKDHPELGKAERKRVCRMLDCRKLSVEACMHAAQNEMLPLRVVVQVLFFEQARAATAGGQTTELPGNIKALLAARKNPTNATAPQEDRWSVSGIRSPKSNLSTLKSKLDEADDLGDNFLDGIEKPSKLKAFCATPNRSKRMLSKLWPISRSSSEKN